MKKLTDRQLEAVKIVYEGQKKGLTPTLFELAEKLGVSSKETAKNLLDAVAKKGYLKREPYRARAIMLKPEAIREIEGQMDFFADTQLRLNFSFSESSHQFPWYATDNNVIVNYGEPSPLTKIIADSSHLITLSDEDSTTTDINSRVQFIVETTNYYKLCDSTRTHLTETYKPLVVSPSMPSPIDGGYLIIENHQLYNVVWSGVTNNHYFRFGKEYGSTSRIFFIDAHSNQLKLFQQSSDSSTADSELKRQLKGFSQYVDFPIYGGALRKDGEVLFWSRSTARDTNDLRYFFLTDITRTSFQGNDTVLLRDIAYNFQNIINNSTR